MLFMPKSFERYTASLRFYIHLSIARNGITDKHLEMLKKIHLAQSVYSANEMQPIDVISFSNALLGAAEIILLQKGKRLAVTSKGGGIFMINRHLLSAVILQLVNGCGGKSCEFTISALTDKIIIKVCGTDCSQVSPTVVKALDGVLLSERKQKRVIVSFPTVATNKKPIITENEWFFLTDKLSPVNIYLKNFPDIMK